MSVISFDDDDALYGLNDLGLEKWNAFKQRLFGLLGDAVRGKTGYEIETPFPQSHTRLVLRCTDELLDVVYSQRRGVINESILDILGGACFLISMKLFYSYDFLQDDNVLLDHVVKEFVKRPIPPLPSGKKEFEKEFKLFEQKLKIYKQTCKEMRKKLVQMEQNIMKKTDWKGCAAFYLDKIYDDEASWMFGSKKSKKSVRKSKKSVT